VLLLADNECGALLDQGFQGLGDEEFENGIQILAKVDRKLVFAQPGEPDLIYLGILRLLTLLLYLGLPGMLGNHGEDRIF